MKSARLLILAILAIFLFTAGCSGCRKGADQKMDRAADARITALSEALPTSADAALVVPEIDAMRDSLDITMERISAFQPHIRMLEQQISRELGLKVTDPQSWEDSGINPEGSLIVAVIGNRPVVAAYIDDRQKFEGRFIERLRRSGSTEGPVRSETVGGQAFKVSGDGAGNDIAWFYRDAMVFLAMPPFDALGTYRDGTALTIANSVAQTEPEKSLGRSEPFQAFRKGLGDHHPLSFYVDAEKYFQRPESDRIASGLDSLIESLVGWSQSNANGAGIALSADEKTIELRAFVGGEDELLQEARKAFGTEADVDWSGMLTANAILGVRTGFDLPSAMKTYMESLPDDERRRLARQIAQLGRNYQLDMEEDVFNAFSGHSLLVFFGVGGDMNRIIAGMGSDNPMDIVRTLLGNSGLLLNLHFADDEKLETLLDKVDELTGDFVVRRPLIYQGDAQDGMEIFEPRSLNMVPARLFTVDEVVTIAAAGIGENAAYEYMMGKRSEGSLADSDEFPLGKRFTESDSINGIYLNFDNLRKNLRRMPLAAGFANQLQPFHELLITGDVEEHGFYMTVTLDFTEPLQADEAQ